MAEVQYVDGNVNNPVVVHGDDPANPENVLVTHLGGTTSILKDSVTEMNEHDTSQLPVDKKDAEIASLKKQIADSEENE